MKRTFTIQQLVTGIILLSSLLFASQKEGYLIIATDTYLNSAALKKFVTYRERLYDVTTVSVTDAGGSASVIKEYVSELYTNNNLKYLLFVGKPTELPYEYDDYYTFHNYGKIDSDGYLDVHVGCFFVRSEEGLENIVTKTIHTEDNIDNYPFVQTQFSTFKDDAHIEDECGLIRDRYWECTSDYTTSWMVPDPRGSNTQYVQDLYNEINRNGTRFVAYQGHGLETAWADGSAYIQGSNVENLTNSDVFPMVLSNACLTGSFQESQPCFGEIWTTAEGGACAFYGASNNSYVYQKMLNAGFACAVTMHDSLQTIGELFTFAKAFVRDSIHITSLPGFERVSGVSNSHEKMYNLIGDPALNMKKYPESPVNTISHSLKKSSMKVHGTQNGITVTVGSPAIYSVKLFSLRGQLLMTLADNMNLSSGTTALSFGSSLANGSYIVQVAGNNSVVHEKVSIMK